MWLRNPTFQRWVGGGWLERAGIYLVSQLEMVGLATHKDRAVARLIRRVRRERRWLMTTNEAFTLYACARAQSRLDGEMAEVGCYEGASTRLICEAKGTRALHVFDTFAGMPEPTADDRVVHRGKMYACSLESVRAYLRGHEGVSFYAGRFPETAGPIAERQFSFVNLDVDLYESTRTGLEFFYPRMVVGGVILSHDYSVLAGVRRAFDEFLADKPEGLWELATTQCLVVKR